MAKRLLMKLGDFLLYEVTLESGNGLPAPSAFVVTRSPEEWVFGARIQAEGFIRSRVN